MFRHKDIKMIVWHALRRRVPTLERLLLSVYIICILFCFPCPIRGFLMAAFKAISAVCGARVKVRGGSTRVKKRHDLSYS